MTAQELLLFHDFLKLHSPIVTIVLFNRQNSQIFYGMEDIYAQANIPCCFTSGEGRGHEWGRGQVRMQCILPRFSRPSLLIPLQIETSNRNTVVELKIELKVNSTK